MESTGVENTGASQKRMSYDLAMVFFYEGVIELITLDIYRHSKAGTKKRDSGRSGGGDQFCRRSSIEQVSGSNTRLHGRRSGHNSPASSS